jgi:hypothetical protein
MSDIELQLRTAMHAAVDGVEASPRHLITLVMRRRRRLAAQRAAVAVLAAVAITVPIGIALHGRISRSASHPASPLTSPPAKLPTSMRGLPIPAGMNFEFLVTTPNGADWYSTATQRTDPIASLPALAGGYQFGRVAGGWVASPLNYQSPCPTNQCAGPPVTFYFIADGSQTATRIGTGYWGNGVDPGVRAGTVWLVTYPAVTTNLTASSSAQLFSTAGQPLGPRYRLPANTLIGRGMGRYLLLDLDTGDESHFELWDPGTRRVIGHFDNVVARGPEQVVWTNSCYSCRLEITNVATGKTVTTSIPGAQSPNLDTALSDDGRLLAVRLPGQEVTIINTETGSMTHIAGTALSGGDFEGFDWQNGGHRLIITAGPNSRPGPDQIAYWQPGDTQLHVVTIRNPLELPEIETGAY